MIATANHSIRLPIASSTAQLDRKLEKDLRLLGLFVEMYCDANHQFRENAKVVVVAEALVGHRQRPVRLCPQCAKLVAHAWVKRSMCPMNPKPACRHCPSHCYQPAYRAQIRKIMRESGLRMVMRGRLDYLVKLLF